MDFPNELFDESLDTEDNHKERSLARAAYLHNARKFFIEMKNKEAAVALQQQEKEAATVLQHEADLANMKKQCDEATAALRADLNASERKHQQLSSRQSLFHPPPPPPFHSSPGTPTSPESHLNRSGFGSDAARKTKVKLPRFKTGDLWETFSKLFLEYTANCSEEEKLLLLNEALDDEAKKFNLALTDCHTFDERFATLRQNYKLNAADISKLKSKFLHRKQLPEESVKKYCAAKIEMASVTGMNMEAAIANIVDNMHFKLRAIFRNSHPENPTTYKHLLEGAEAVDSDPYKPNSFAEDDELALKSKDTVNKVHHIDSTLDMHYIIKEAAKETANIIHRERRAQLNEEADEYKSKRKSESHSHSDSKKPKHDYKSDVNNNNRRESKDYSKDYSYKRRDKKEESPPPKESDQRRKFCDYCKKSGHVIDDCWHYDRFDKYSEEKEPLPPRAERRDWMPKGKKLDQYLKDVWNNLTPDLTLLRKMRRKRQDIPEENELRSGSSLSKFANKAPHINKTVYNLKSLNKRSCLTTEGTLGGILSKVIIDTGSPVSIIGSKIWDNIKDKNPVLKSVETKVQLAAANGNILRTLGTIDLPLAMYGMSRYNEFIICPELYDKVILGMDTLDDWHMEILLPKRLIQCVFATGITAIIPIQVEHKESADIDIRNVSKVHIKPHTMMWVQAKVDAEVNEVFMVSPNKHSLTPGRVIVANTLATVEKDNTIMVPIMNFSKYYVTLKPNAKIPANITLQAGMFSVDVKVKSTDKTPDTDPEITDHSVIIEQINKLDLATDSDLTPEQQSQLQQLLINNADIFAVNPKAPGLQINVKHFIDTENHSPVHTKPWRLSQHEKEVIAKEVIEMLKNGIIRKSKSPWNASVVLAGKKDGSLRFCVDYRKLNLITKKDVYPLPRIDDMLEKFRAMCFFSTFDFASGYWQVEINETDKEKTAFTTPEGLFEWNVMPFGLTNAPWRW